MQGFSIVPFSEGCKFAPSNTDHSHPPIFYCYYVICHLMLMNCSLYIINKLRAGNCCLLQPFSPVLEPRQGGGILIYAGLVNLAQDTCIYAHLAVQAWGNPSAWHHVPEAPHLLVLSVGPIPSEPLPVHSSPNFTHIWVCVFLLHTKTLNRSLKDLKNPASVQFCFISFRPTEIWQWSHSDIMWHNVNSDINTFHLSHHHRHRQQDHLRPG